MGAFSGGPSAVRAGDRTVRSSPGTLVLNDDGHVFLYLSDDLRKADLRRYLESYCRPGVGTVAYCVGDMSWPTFYPTRVGAYYRDRRPPGDLKRARAFRNLDHFAGAPGGYFGEIFRTLHALGKRVLASFRMNDAHFTSPDDPYVSPFWKQHVGVTLGPAYGYYGGCLNYTADEVREHFVQRVVEFAGLYPEIDGVELDAMRSPFFFPPGKGRENAPRFTELVRRIKGALSRQAERLKRPAYLLTVNVPITPELALECGLDVAAWDAERLFDWVSVGTYQAYMDHPIRRWKQALGHGTPVYAYVNCSPQDGQYLGLEEYRAAAANAFGGGADGVYLFNYPCLFELALQVPGPVEPVPMTLPDLRRFGQPDLSKVGQALDEIGRPDTLRGKDKRFLFYFSKSVGYRHHAPALPAIDRGSRRPLQAVFHCYEDAGPARERTLRFKVENVARTEAFQPRLNGRAVAAASQRVRYAANGRDTRMHTVGLGPYLEYELSLQPADLNKGENVLEVLPAKLLPNLATRIELTEVELSVHYGTR